ncbi:MAG: tetratricopeptide repeat protein, partial [Acidobacteriota bacterium]
SSSAAAARVWRWSSPRTALRMSRARRSHGSATAQYRSIIARLEKSQLGDSLPASYACLQLGRTLARAGQVTEALPWLRRARDIRRAVLGDDHRQTRAAAALLDETTP